MLIKALCDYSDKIAEKSDSSKIPIGFSEQPVHFEVLLTPDGTVSNIIDIRITDESTDKKSKPKPRIAVLPERSQKTSVYSNLIEHRPLYIFGLNLEKGTLTPYDKTNKAKKSNTAFKERNLEFFESLKSDICKAYYNFILSWSPESQTQNEHLLALGNAYSTSSFCFGLDGKPGVRLEEDDEFRKKYTEYLLKSAEENATDGQDSATCAILGKDLPIARIHDKIKFPGGNTTGCVLVGMKEDAYTSYGKSQSYNSNVSEEAMKKYTSTFNMLLSDKKHYTYLQDMTIVYFAMKSDDSKECDLFSQLFGFEGVDNAQKSNDDLSAFFKQLRDGTYNDISALCDNPDVTFYIAGLSPNSSRICQKFIYRDKFGSIIKNLVMHQKDMSASERSRQVSFYSISRELVSPKSKEEKVPPPLISGIMLSALKGYAYPNELLSRVIRRIKTDSDEENNHFIKFNDTRIGIIKACLNRKARLKNKEEEFSMALDTDNKSPAYRCGRLFAVLEKIQQVSSGGNLNRTIMDSYFASACTKPKSTFPKLIRLSNNHMRKLPESGKIYYQKLIGEILSEIGEEFPSTFNLDDQGRMIIGYYHQNKDLYAPKSDNK